MAEFDEMLFCSGQNALQADQQEIADQMRMKVLGTAAHEFLLKARNSFADGSFDFPLRFRRHRMYPNTYPVVCVRDGREVVEGRESPIPTVWRVSYQMTVSDNIRLPSQPRALKFRCQRS